MSLASPAASAARIRVLPEALVNRIAAGEVVERPASVVKELVENALDAGATRIDIVAGAGGRTLRVADNGGGMTPDDAQRAFLNHATSKLSDDDDLTHIETLGFRGEALASIAAVARVVCETRRSDSPVGCRVRISGSDPVARLEDAGCAPGTVMEISDLFYNAPARLKFLKKPGSELAAIEELIEALAIANPRVRFTLTVNDRQTLSTRGEGDLRDALREALSLGEDAQALLPIAFEDDALGLQLSGFISPPTHLKSARRWLLTYVNGRIVRCGVLSKAIESAYASLAPSGRFPYGAIFLTLPLSDVDVNVHPAKREVRYAQPNVIFSFVRHGVARALEEAGVSALLGDSPNGALTPAAGAPSQAPDSLWARGAGNAGLSPSGSDGTFRQGAFGFSHSGVSHSGSSPSALSHSGLYRPLEAAAGAEGLTSPAAARDDEAPFHVIGQLFNTYILLETPQGLMVVDQHIACERAAFEAFKRQTLPEAAQSQGRLLDIVLPMSPTRRALLGEHQDALASLGYVFLLDEAEPGGVRVRGVPALDAERLDPLVALEALLAHLEETGEPVIDRDLLMATMACHSSVRAGDTLSREAMTRIIERWLACRLPWTCPHGRPIAHTIRAEELNRFFDRPGLPGGS